MNARSSSPSERRRRTRLVLAATTAVLLLVPRSIAALSTKPPASRPSPSPSSPISFEEELGVSPTLRNVYFDPLGLATEESWAFYREAELKHGRVAMLATVGMGLPDIVLRQGGDSSSSSSSAKFDFWNDLVLSPSHVRPHPLRFGDVPCGITALKVVPWQGWLQIVAFVGLLETTVFVQRDRRDMPGDYGTGYLGLRDKARHERSLLVELENGRLAMVAFVGQVAAEINTGQTVGDQWRELSGWLESVF